MTTPTPRRPRPGAGDVPPSELAGLRLDGGERLALAQYEGDFAERMVRVTDRDSWKLQRRQDFQVRDSDSWDAARRGDWEEAMRLIDGRRETLLADERQEHARGHYFHRTVVVERPFTLCMRWLLASLRQRDECGEDIRIVDVEQVRSLEGRRRLPALVVLGGRTLYHVQHRDGFPDGAVRYTNPDLVARAEALIRALYEVGEDIQTYYQREVAPLPPPRGRR